MIGPAMVRRVAAETGFREEAVEKALYLAAILERLSGHPDLRGSWVLKGGTALNLCHLDVPRLSVDVDINYIGHRDLEAMKAARPVFERAVVACCEREGCQVRRAPEEHAGGKYRLRYAGGVSGTGTLELDVNFVQRVPMFDPEDRRVRFPPDAGGRPVPVLTFEELAAGKLTALLMRAAARDAFDAWQLVQRVPDLSARPTLRMAFVVQAAMARADVRTKGPADVTLTSRQVRDELFPLLRPEAIPFQGDVEGLTGQLNETTGRVMANLLAWQPREHAFLDAILDRGEVLAEVLTDDPALQERIAAQPMLHWKARHVREYKRLPATEPEET